jgi:hypothetical protein
MLVRLLYASRAAGAVTHEMIESILEQSCKHNPELGITGFLCYESNVFMQILEGGRDAVNRLYGDIVRDARHRDIVLLHYSEVVERHFANWTMAQGNLAKTNPSTLLKYSEKPVLDPYAVSGQASLALLEELIATGQMVGRVG